MERQTPSSHCMKEYEQRYESLFSRHKKDCGEARGSVHRIHLVDDKPFCLPYRRIPPSQYEKLRTSLNEMKVSPKFHRSLLCKSETVVQAYCRNCCAAQAQEGSQACQGRRPRQAVTS